MNAHVMINNPAQKEVGKFGGVAEAASVAFVQTMRDKKLTAAKLHALMQAYQATLDSFALIWEQPRTTNGNHDDPLWQLIELERERAFQAITAIIYRAVELKPRDDHDRSELMAMVTRWMSECGYAGKDIAVAVAQAASSDKVVFP